MMDESQGISSRIINILTYEGSSKHISINWFLIFLTFLTIFLFSYKRRVLVIFIFEFLFLFIFQIVLCLFEGCVGVSIVWNGMAGIFILRILKTRHRTSVFFEFPSPKLTRKQTLKKTKKRASTRDRWKKRIHFFSNMAHKLIYCIIGVCLAVDIYYILEGFPFETHLAHGLAILLGVLLDYSLSRTPEKNSKENWILLPAKSQKTKKLVRCPSRRIKS